MRLILILSIAFSLISCKNKTKKENDEVAASTEEIAELSDNSLIIRGGEHFKSLRQVNCGGDSAEASWSPDGSQLIFQSDYSEWRRECEQMFIMNADQAFEHS